MSAPRTWDTEGFERSLTSVSPATREAYGRDIASFIEWAERASLTGPERVERTTLRRYLAYLATLPVRGPHDLAARLGASSVLRVARAHRPDRGRSCIRPARAEGRVPAASRAAP